MTHRAYMLNRMWKIDVGLCANAEVRNRHGSESPSAGTNAMSWVSPGTTRWPT